MIKFNKLIEALHEAASIANSKLSEQHNDLLDNYFEEDEKGMLNAKTVSVNYPVVKKNGETAITTVSVPLITLVPINSAQIQSLKFSIELEVALDDNNLLVSFAKKRNSEKDWFQKEPHSSATIELIVKPSLNSEGLQHLIEGYEKVLRSQIPN